MIDRDAYAAELTDRLGKWTKYCALKIAEREHLGTAPIPREAVDRGLEAAARRLILEYPLTDETLEGWEEFYARKPSFTHIFDRLLREEIKAQEAAQTASQASPCIGEKAAAPCREMLMQYIGLGFTLYAQKEMRDGTRRFCDFLGIAKWSKENAAIRAAEELDIALASGICLFAFLPPERGYVCLDVDIGHSSGKNGFLAWQSLLLDLGFNHNPLKSAAVWAETPSGGRHYYFLHRESIRKYKAEPAAGVEIFGAGTGKTLQAAGSFRKGRLYRLHGRLHEATMLPLSLVCHVAESEESMDAVKAEEAARTAYQGRRRGYSFRQKCETAEDRRRRCTIDQCVAFGVEDAKSDSRANCAWSVGKSSGYAYPLEELKAACWRHPAFANRAGFSDAELEYQLKRGIAESKFK